MDHTKKFVWDEEMPPIIYRPGTSDEAIIQAVLVEKKEYAFPAIEPKVCFDIGANIGVVSMVLAKLYPKSKIYAFEPVEENFKLLAENVSHFPNVKALPYGLGGDSGSRRIWHSDDKTNLGGFSVAIKNLEGKNDMIQVRDVASATHEFGTPEIIKIDVEGAEAEIFESMPNLERVNWITGELHGVREFQVLDLLSRNFDIACLRNFGVKCWHFHAVNKTLANGHGSKH